MSVRGMLRSLERRVEAAFPHQECTCRWIALQHGGEPVEHCDRCGRPALAIFIEDDAPKERAEVGAGS